jgi:catechol 2,3-dioxygenase-like lactoylglutathione lyase family enzyme
LVFDRSFRHDARTESSGIWTAYAVVLAKAERKSFDKIAGRDGMIRALHHVQLAMPRGQEDNARAFYRDVLGMTERPKPENLARRGGVWFFAGDAEIHLGVEDEFRAAKKAHPALVVNDLKALGSRCVAAGFPVSTDEPLPGFDRIYVNDPFGNRIELLEPAPGA